VSLDGTSQNCALETYPGGWAKAIGYTDGGVNACGGRRNQGDAYRCWRFNGTTWSLLPNSTNGHYCEGTRYIVVQKGWWVISTNGSCGSWKINSEIFTGEKWIPGPGLPDGLEISDSSAYHHTLEQYCLVNLSPTQTMLIGGNIGTYGRREVYIYDWNTENWTTGAALVTRLSGHGCVNLGSLGVLAGGGSNGGPDAVPFVNLYDSVQKSWSRQPDMPSGKNQFYPYFHFPRSPTLFNWNGTAIGLFGSEDQIYKWNKENGTWSVLEGVQLPVTYDGRFERAIQVPDDFVKNCN